MTTLNCGDKRPDRTCEINTCGDEQEECCIDCVKRTSCTFVCTKVIDFLSREEDARRKIMEQVPYSVVGHTMKFELDVKLYYIDKREDRREVRRTDVLSLLEGKKIIGAFEAVSEYDTATFIILEDGTEIKMLWDDLYAVTMLEVRG